MAHNASVRGSTRSGTRGLPSPSTNQDSQGGPSTSVNDSLNIEHSLVSDLSQMSVISLSSNEGGDELSHSSKSVPTHRKQPSKENVSRGPPLVHLEQLKTVSDIEACVDSDMYQLNVLHSMEQRWKAIASNFGVVLNHLEECSGQVSLASIDCLRSLVQSVDSTCDEVDGETKALYHLMTKCDELATKLSAASSFHEEIKTLRKSIETLENCYKLRPVRVPATS